MPNKASSFKIGETRWLFIKHIVKLWGLLWEGTAHSDYMGILGVPEHKLLTAESTPGKCMLVLFLPASSDFSFWPQLEAAYFGLALHSVLIFVIAP